MGFVNLLVLGLVGVVTVVSCVIWLLFSLVSVIWLFASVIIFRVCVPLVVGFQLNVMGVLVPAFRLFSMISAICVVPSYSLLLNVVASVWPWLDTVTVMGYVVPVLMLDGICKLESVRSGNVGV